MDRHDLTDQYVEAVRQRLRWRDDVGDITDELGDHLRSATDSLIEQGIAPAEAERQVLAGFGDPAEVSMSFVSSGSRGLAMPTEATRAAGVAAIVSAVAWCCVALAWNGSYLAEQANGKWDGIPQGLFLAATLAMMAATATQLVTWIGLDKRHGGLGVLGTAGLVATGLGVLASLVSWFFPFWASILAVGTLLLATPMLRRGLAPRPATALAALAWPVGLATFIVLRALEVGPVDQWGDHPLAINVGLSVGAVLSATSLGLLGRWLAREEPATVPIPAQVA